MSRRHFIPKALHANMFLVQQEADVMDRDVMLLPSEMSLDAFVQLPQMAECVMWSSSATRRLSA
jgi:chloride channel protein, CIC family